MKYILTFIQLIFIAGLHSSCSPPAEDPAIQAYQKAISYLSVGSSQKLWSLLSVKSKRILNQRLGRPEHSYEAPQSFEIELDWAFESPFAGRATLYSDTTEPESANLKLVHTIYATKSWIIPITLEEGIWRVHLLGARQLSPNHIAH